jgi:hypothetical protein
MPRTAQLACLAYLASTSGLVSVAAADLPPLVDLHNSIQQLDSDTVRLQLKLEQAFGTDDKQHNLNLTTDWSQGAAGTGWGSTPSWNRAKHTSRFVNVTYTGDTIRGEIAVTLQADRWVPKDKQPIDLTVRITAKVTSLFAPGEKAFDDAYWADSDKRSGKLANVAGTFELASEKFGNSSGKLSGALRLPNSAGKWNHGQKSADGVRVGFDMGKKRVNWTHMRNTRLNFSEPKDLTQYGGLRVQIGTAQPRTDAAVSVWLKEADGSWYYYSRAVPLSAESNSADLAFADFEEAEWVSPDGGTSFMDEDYSLDLSQVTAMAVGVVNAFGIGPVTFTIQDIGLLPASSVQPVEVSVSGKTLSINDHEFIPAGLFGGFAPDLPQRYRPGTQRRILTVPGAYARNVYDLYYYKGSDVPDGIQLIQELAKDKYADLHKLVGGKAVKNLKKNAVEPKKKKGNWPKNARSTSVRFLKNLVNKKELSDVALLKNYKDLIAQADNAQPGDGQQLLAHRQMLDAILGDLVKDTTTEPPHEAFFIDCQGDRTQTASFLKRDDWEAYLKACGVAVGQANAQNGNRVHTEFWNEPYLNWQKGRNYGTKLFRTDLAGEGKPVIVRRKDGSTNDVIPHFEWYRAKDKKGNDVWKVRDPTAFTYWSGKGNEYIYNRMFEVYGKAVKETNPDTMVTAGWGMKWNEDGWAAWDMLYLPTFEKNIAYIDGVHEHHYMGDTTDIAGSYEVLAAYGMTEHNKWLYGYNTETTDLLDIPAVGEVNTPEKAAQAKNFRVGTYNLRDVIYMCAQIPDKAKARTVIHYDHTPSGSDMTWDTLKDLRGRLVKGSSTDSKVWVASSIDGTDPVARRPEGGHALVVAVWNDHRDSRQVSIDLTAPTGTSFKAGTWEAPRQNRDTLGVTFNKGELAATGTNHQVTLTIPGRSVWKASIPLSGSPVTEAEVTRQQFFANDILSDVMPGQSVTKALSIDADALQSATKATVRCVLEHAAHGEAVVSLGGQDFVLPPAINRDNGNLIVELPIDLKLLQAQNNLEFKVGTANSAGYMVAMASVVLE